jgi:hypothetical protein
MKLFKQKYTLFNNLNYLKNKIVNGVHLKLYTNFIFLKKDQVYDNFLIKYY